MNYRFCSVLFFFLFAFTTSKAQDLEIIYDVVTDKVSYIRKGKTINTPKVRKNRNLLVRLVNFNNYQFEANIAAEAKQEAAPNGSSNSFNMLGLVSSMGDTSSDNYIATLTAPSAAISADSDNGDWDDDDDDDGFGFGSSNEMKDESNTIGAQALEARFQELNNEYESVRQDVLEAERQVQTATDKVIGHLNTLLLTTITAEQLQKLKLNPFITNAVRQQIAGELVQEFLQKEDAIQLRDALDFANTFEVQSKQDRNNLRDTRQMLDFELEKMTTLKSKVDAIGTNTYEPIRVLNKNIGNKLKTARGLLYTSDLSGNSSQDILDVISSFNFPEKVMELYLDYQELTLNAYEYTFVTTASDDYMEITISIYNKIDSLGNTISDLVKERTLTIPVVGGIKVNTSAGLGFASYFKRQQTFYNADSTIVANPGDNFVPLVTTFLHFYPQSMGSVSVGGNFGIGFPILGDNKSLHFFIGPSIFMGKSQRFVLNFGLMGGQVQRLDRGLEVNDIFGSEGELIPTKNKYELGYFLSGTFNL